MTEFWRSLKKWFMGWLNGVPHYVVGDPSRPYILRWYLLPRNQVACLYLHKFLHSDDDRALHTHPWAYASLLLRGRYVEVTSGNRRIEYRAGNMLLRGLGHAHRIELPDGKPCWTLFLTGPRRQEWGFLCPKGFVHWKDFTAPGKSGETGRGCGEMS